MIVVFTDEINDISAFDVLDWLIYFEQDSVIINEGHTEIELVEYSVMNGLLNLKLKVNERIINTNEIESYYWRRGFIGNNFNNKLLNDEKMYPFYSHLLLEQNVLAGAVMEKMEQRRKIGGFFDNLMENKLISLQRASDVGMEVPNTIITNNKAQLVEFMTKHKRVISKAINEGLSVDIDNFYFYQYTEEIDLESIPEEITIFFPTLFQEKLDKKYELRIFFANGECFTMAIFSQKDEQTKTDFRKYNRIKPNRMVPYKLPGDIENKIKKFMEISGMDTGSVDMVYTKDRRFVFLEINPVGQFGMVSVPCNYYIERKIANHLINK